MFKFKAIVFCLTVFLLAFYDYFPQNTIDLHPQLTKHVEESVDSTIGGDSQLEWLNKEKPHWICHLRAGTLHPYCGISLAWSDAPFQQLDLSSFSGLEVDLEYVGQAQYIRVFIRNYYHLPNTLDSIGAAKFNSISTSVKEFESGNTVTLPFNELRVADWWIDDNLIPPKDIKPDVRQAIAVGLDIPYPKTLGRHEFKLHSLRATGPYFSRESFYLAIIIFWALLLLIEILVNQAKLRMQLKRDGQQLKALQTKSAIYQEKAEHDKLTSILNREGLNRIVDELNSTKLLHQYTLLVLDLDFFKQVNDKHGHAIGDEVLQETTNVLRECMRSYDIIARWGGEEFVILFHCMNTANIYPFAEKVRKSIETTSFAHGKVPKLTISIGATNMFKSESFDNAFLRADKALYEAKNSGRNTTVVTL